MWGFHGSGAWGWVCLIPLLVMLGFMVMMFVMARGCFMGRRGAAAFEKRVTGGDKMKNQTTGSWKEMRGSMMQSCMERMGCGMPAAAHDRGMQEVLDRWSEDLQGKILDLLDRKSGATPSEIAEALGIPDDVALSLLHRLALAGKVRFSSVERTT